MTTADSHRTLCKKCPLSIAEIRTALRSVSNVYQFSILFLHFQSHSLASQLIYTRWMAVIKCGVAKWSSALLQILVKTGVLNSGFLGRPLLNPPPSNSKGYLAYVDEVKVGRCAGHPR